MTAKYSDARQRPLSSKQTQPRIKRHDIVCLHTMVGSLTGTNEMFKQNGYGGTESHYGVGGKWGRDVGENLDGAVWQWQDRAFSADANLDGNYRVISIETADNAPKSPSDIQEWTTKQTEAIIDLVAWECSLAAHADCPSTWACHKGVMWEGVRVAIPPVLIPDTKSTRRGLALHRQGVEPAAGIGKLPGYLVSGGERWSEHAGKECPGDRRVKQFKEIIIPAVQARLKPQKTEDDVTPKELEDAIVKVLTTAKIVPNVPTEAQLAKDPNAKTTYFTVVGALGNVEHDQDAKNDTDAKTVSDVKAMLAALMVAHGVTPPEGVKP